MANLLLAVVLSTAPKADLVKIHVPPSWFGDGWVSTETGKPVRSFWCGRKMERPLLAALACVAWHERRHKRKLLHTFSGCYSPRKKRTKDEWSRHAYGEAIDINHNPGTPVSQTFIDPIVVMCFKNNGFNWGGDWFNYKDNIHFELRR